MPERTIAMILAGGQGSRLSILSEHRAKPAVPFGSNYRIIDFVISNVMHTGIPYLGILTQYKPYSLMTHVNNGEAWGFTGRRSVAKILPPYVGTKAGDWYAGTADAVYQNISFISRYQDTDNVLLLSGDHIYKMVYTDLLRFHRDNNADLTIATQPVSWDEAHRFGVLKSDESGRVEGFEEKPKGKPISNQANLGIYVFKKSFLMEHLLRDAADPNSTHDFGHDLIPYMVENARCFAFEYKDYWRDVGTLQSYWDANMECLNPHLGLDLSAWHVHTNSFDVPTHFHMPTHVHGNGTIVNSMVGKGSNIRGSVINSIVFRGVEVGEGAEVRDSILMDGAKIGAGATVQDLIADKFVEVGAGSVICSGDRDSAPASEMKPGILNTGLTLLGMYSCTPENYRIGRNCLVYPDLSPKDFVGSEIPDGGTILNKGDFLGRRQ